MRFMLFIGFVCLLPIGAGAWLFINVDYPIVVTSKYATYNDAVADDLFDRGWLPDFIPLSSTGIVTTNDLDLNTSVGEFYYDPAETDSFLLKLSPYQGLDPGYETNIQEMKSKDYLPYKYRENSTVWVFFVHREMGHVSYYLWTEY